ncbi:MAG: CPBP family intramembrane glutamic endopeptidase [Terriglobia bacterium]
MLGKLVEILFAVLLVAGVPVLSFVTARRADLRLLPRLDLYLSAALSQWLLASLGVLVVVTVGPGLRAIGFGAVGFGPMVRWAVVLTVVSLAALGLVVSLERRNWLPDEADLVRLLIPRTPRERLLAVLFLAPTAALCEEFLYRGFLLREILGWWGSPSLAWVVSSLAFGLAHAYQGSSGMARAALLGAFLALPVVRLGSLYPSIVAHFLIDVVALAWLGPWLLRHDVHRVGGGGP